MTDTSASLPKPPDGTEQCPDCEWYHRLGADCTRCSRLGSPQAPSERPAAGATAAITGPSGLTRPPSPPDPETAAETAGQVDPAASDAPAPDPEPEPQHPEVHRVPVHGMGLLRVGNPGNRGGGRRPEHIRQELRRILAEHGTDFLEQVIRGDPIQPVPVKGGGVMYVPADARTRVVATQIALQAAEGMIASVPSTAVKQRVLRVVLADESTPRERMQG